MSKKASIPNIREEREWEASSLDTKVQECVSIQKLPSDRKYLL